MKFHKVNANDIVPVYDEKVSRHFWRFENKSINSENCKGQ